MIPRLEDLSLGKRILLAIVFVVVAILLLIGLSKLIGSEAEAQVVPPSQWDEHLITLDKIALDDAYRDRINHLFETWMRDETGQPQRAIAGATQARRAYVTVMQQIQERDKAVQDRKPRP